MVVCFLYIKMVKQFIKRLITLNIIFVSIMTLYRIIFISYYSNWSELLQYLKDLIQVFVLGARYDCAILAYINLLVALLFIILWFIGNQKLFIKFVKSLKYYYTIFLGFIITLLCIDFGFFTYFGNHINYMIFEAFNNRISYLWHISKNEHSLFFILFLGLIICLFFVFFLSKYILEKNIDNYTLYNGVCKKIIGSLIFLLIILCLTLNIMHIDRNNLEKYFSFSRYNCFFTLFIINNNLFDLVSLSKDYIEEQNWIKNFEYQNDTKKAFADFLDKNEKEIPENRPEETLLKTTQYNQEIEKIKPNVVLVVVESLGTDLLCYNSEKFNIMGEIKKHFDEDIVFYNCLYSYASSQISVDNMLLNFIKPPKTNSAFFNHSFSYFYYKCFTFCTNVYRRNNYHTYNLSKKLLYMSDKLFDTVRIVNYNDELICNDVFNALEEDNNKPKFIFCATITNHHPFNIPKDYKSPNLEVPHKLEGLEYRHFLSYEYTCQKIGEFLTRLKNSKYADNTIVAIVGDHRERLPEFDDNIISYKSVPFYLYVPNKLKPAKEKINTTRIVSHFDIIPTLYELSLSSVPYYSIGTSVFDENYQNAISSSYSDAIIINGNDMCTYDINLDKINSYKLKRQNDKLVQYEKTETTNKHNKMVKQYKAAIVISQYLMKEAKKQN